MAIFDLDLGKLGSEHERQLMMVRAFELGDMDSAFERAKSLAGLTDAKLVAYEQPFSFSSLFRIQSALPRNAQIKLDLGLDVPGLEAGRLYFISSTYVQ